MTQAAAELEHVRIVPRERVTEVVLDRAPHNALDERLIEELTLTAAYLSGPGRPAVVVLRSACRSFMVGADLNMMEQGWDHVRAMIRAFQTAVNRWERIPCPTIAAIGGHALGAGCELALACDFRIMATGRPLIGLPEVQRGLISAGGGTQRMIRTIGRAHALDLCIRGKMLEAEAAERIGLVTETCVPEALDELVAALAEELASLPPLTVAAIKRCLLDGSDTDLKAGLTIEEEEMVVVGSTEDAREGVASFLEKRPPHFTGR